MGITGAWWLTCTLQLLYHACVVISVYGCMSLLNQSIALCSTKYLQISTFCIKHWTLLVDYLERADQKSCLHTGQGSSSDTKAARWPNRHPFTVYSLHKIQCHNPLRTAPRFHKLVPHYATHKILVTVLLVENGGRSPVEGATKMIRELEHVILQGEAKKTEFVQP